MATTYKFQLQGSWSGARLGTGHVETDTLSTSISVPAQLGGPGLGTNPEQLLISAAAACYLITLATLLTNRHIPYVRIDLETEGVVEDNLGLRFDAIVHRPVIVVEEPADEALLASLANHAEHACMISSALRGNVLVRVTPQVAVQATKTTAPS